MPQGHGSYRRALGEALVEAGRRSRDVVVLDADTPTSTGTIAFSKAYPDRFFNIGISEQDLLGTAAGMAIAGKIPVAAAFAAFMMRAWEQVRNTVARDRLNVKLAATHAGLSDHMDGASHQAFEDVALMRVLPGFTVIAPADECSTKELVLKALLEHAGPVYIRLGRENAPLLYEDCGDLEIGKARVIEDAVDAAVFSYGAMLGVAVEAARILAREGIKVGLIDAYSIKPLDRDTIVKHAVKAGLAVTVEDHNIIGGLGSAIAELLAEHKPVRLVRIGVQEAFGASSRSYQDLLEYMGLTPERVALRIKKEVVRVEGVKAGN